VSHYFDPAPTTGHRVSTVALTLPDVTLRLGTDSGVFAASAVDPGTKYLLLDGPKPDPLGEGALLDIGCGYGPIALTLARRAPRATIYAVEVNERARALCVANAAANGIDNVVAGAPHGIWSNPPIRIGKAALHALLTRWLARLAPDAHASLVVQRHLGSDSLAEWLTSQGYPTERLGSRRAYRILDTTRKSAA
jgi:16S rRNA (guanine1207-N2)-methyltransferase